MIPQSTTSSQTGFYLPQFSALTFLIFRPKQSYLNLTSKPPFHNFPITLTSNIQLLNPVLPQRSAHDHPQPRHPRLFIYTLDIQYIVIYKFIHRGSKWAELLHKVSLPMHTYHLISHQVCLVCSNKQPMVISDPYNTK